jgi:hypothetical protein
MTTCADTSTWYKWMSELSYQQKKKLTISLIEDYPCKNNIELCTREKYWIQDRLSYGWELKNSKGPGKVEPKESKFTIKKELFNQTVRIVDEPKYERFYYYDPETKKRKTKSYKNKDMNVIREALEEALATGIRP